MQLWRAEGLLTVEQGHITLLQPTMFNRLANSA
jgi:hypothetical protein